MNSKSGRIEVEIAEEIAEEIAVEITVEITVEIARDEECEVVNSRRCRGEYSGRLTEIFTRRYRI